MVGRVVACVVVMTVFLSPPAADAQRRAPQSVSGPSAPMTEGPSEERIYHTMRRQLRVLLAAQDAVRAERGRYAPGFGTTGETVAFTPPAGITITLGFADSAGWVAIATHAALPGKSCVLWAGTVPVPRRPETSHDGNRGGEGEVVCDLVP
ncbi:MAG: hypothetical protein ABR551_09365 [Gemmatimonadales bacterium]